MIYQRELKRKYEADVFVAGGGAAGVAAAVTFNGTLKFDKVGLYSYTIVETGANANGVARDATVFRVMVTVTDDKLLSVTGGIVQGMSGSPLIQNGKLIGAVTHVFVNDPTRGYGIFIENMLAEAEKISD